MYKILTTLSLILAVSKGEDNNVISLTECKPVDRTDDYIRLNRQQYAKTLQNYDIQMEKFNKFFIECVNDIYVLRDMALNSVVKAEKLLSPLALLNDLRKKCVAEYSDSIPTVANTKTAITACATTASNQVNTLLSSALSTKSGLENYYLKTFEEEIKKCGKKFDNKTSDYTICLKTVISNTNNFTERNQKAFGIEMDAAECSGNAIIKTALDCSFNYQIHATSQIAEANILINNCIFGIGVNTCSDGVVVKRAKVHPRIETMPNPFYGRENNSGCLLLKIE